MTAERASAGKGVAAWVLFLAGPTIWFLHFMVVYLIVEAGCAAGDPETEVAGVPVLSFVTIVSTAAAVLATLVLAQRARRAWRAGAVDRGDWLSGDDRSAGLALAGSLLGVVSTVAILFVGVPAIFLDPC